MRGRRTLVIILAVLFVIALSSRTAISYYVDSLWFGSLGYSGVFWRSLNLQWSIFAFAFAATFLILYGWFSFLKRACHADLQNASTIDIGSRRFDVPVDSILNLGGIIGTTIIALATGASFMAEWSRFALYWFAPHNASGPVDPIFGRSLGFYLFTLPAWQFIAGWLLMLAIVACIIAVFFVLITGSTRLFAGEIDISAPLPWRALSLAIASLLAVIAIRVYLSRFDLLLAGHTIFGGVTYTDAHVTVAGLFILCTSLILGTLIAAINLVTMPRVRWLVAAPVPAILCFFALQIWAWYVSSFIVKPNELVREQPYIAHNIDFTRQAFGLDKIAQREFPAETTVAATDPTNNQTTLQNIRLWDWHALQDTLRQIQEIRTYYDFPDIDIDRYQINGEQRQVMLGTRELSLNKLPDSSRNWINEKLIYTHGYGITMNPVNGFTPEGLPNLILSNMPIQSTVPTISVKRPEIYFGQLTDSDVYVKTRQKEFDYPQGQSNSMTSYEGDGGIELGGFLRRLLIAFDRGDLMKLPFSDDITSQSRLLMHRNVRDRVRSLAPFLTFESDPYIVVGQDGRLSFMLDAFTTSDNFPYSTHFAMGNEQVNYLRNSVKIVVDAYSGATTFYVFDAQDPIIAAYRQIFPALFKDASAMPSDLRNHVRYPEMLLKMQASVYGLYHMTDPGVFYNREDLWTVATEVGMNDNGEQATQVMDPNFVLMKLPGESNTEFVGILPFTPSNRNNLIGWLAGRSDGANYGTSVVYNFPKTRLVDGPLQIEARIDQNAQLSGQLSLWNQQGSRVRRGTLLVIPCGRALMYAEPIYLQAERSPMPELRIVVLALQDRLAYGSTFEAALRSLFGGEASSLSPESASSETKNTVAGASSVATSSAAKPADDLNSLITGAAKDLNDYQRLTSEGKLGEAGQKLEELKKKLDALNAKKK
jgi:uncharacterized protein